MAFDKDNPANNPKMGYLMSQFSFETDWDSWEMHPNGDEVVFCISGHIKFILEVDGEQRVVELKPGQYIVVPQNTRHTAKIAEPSSALFLTWGYGTENRKIDENTSV
ncbi:Cupin domain-containing protein [Pseudobacteriovorax antillogorgiicola]|uniref:Cupin domain-containing protein n=2 Tax=Pseudobacteriovorax antillogorgiicola TaxID=1513793 RepID=A0A1Y6BTE8_9BACT|nr:cupin domain [Pseudobacteriovorax antillogorgiicola]SMF27245.1 Cupin domain-containing protein [Pseudobacteriovorax antillogorgiicola]